MVWDWFHWTEVTVTANYAATNFKYVICIDSSTCIAADDSTSDFKYYRMTSTGFLGGNDQVENFGLTEASTGYTLGVGAARSQTAIYLARATRVFVYQIGQSTVQAVVEMGSQIFNLAVSKFV